MARIFAFCILFLQNTALLHGSGLATARRHPTWRDAAAAACSKTGGKNVWARQPLHAKGNHAPGSDGTRIWLPDSCCLGSNLRLSGGGVVSDSGRDMGDNGYGEDDDDEDGSGGGYGDGDRGGNGNGGAARRKQRQQGADNDDVDDGVPGVGGDDDAARLAQGAGDEWEERHREAQEVMKNLHGFDDEDQFLKAKEAYVAGDNEALDEIQRKVSDGWGRVLSLFAALLIMPALLPTQGGDPESRRRTRKRERWMPRRNYSGGWSGMQRCGLPTGWSACETGKIPSCFWTWRSALWTVRAP